ncbi:MAG: hypothetical protein O3C43_21840 [Verrucomicrobia bacterium]|nr:hypothetical protein [Verrucomicrobiota bacterium]
MSLLPSHAISRFISIGLLIYTCIQPLFSQITFDGDCGGNLWWPDGCTVMDVPKTNWSNDGYPAPGDVVIIDFPSGVPVASLEVKDLLSIDAKTFFRILNNFSVIESATFAETSIEMNDGRLLRVGGLLETTVGGRWFGGNIQAGTWENRANYVIEGNSPRLIGTGFYNEGMVSLEGARFLEQGSFIQNEP